MLSYSELLARADVPAGSTWGLFGDEDELGTLNHLTPEGILKAAALIRRGDVFNLDLPVGVFDPPINHRTAPEHTIFSNAYYHRDDKLDGLFLQGTTQIDGLRHFGHPKYGFYNGIPESEIKVGTRALGINRMAERGIVGRGVLLDVGDYLDGTDHPVDHEVPTAITIRDLEATAESQGLQMEHGDIVLVRTGWLSHLFSLSPDERAEIPSKVQSTGLAQSDELVEWIWERQISLLAADNLAVEVVPPIPTSPFFHDPDLRALQGIHRGMAHPVLLALLGLPLGELWWLDDLARDCRNDNIWEFFLSSHPLNVTGGVGSPANAFAIK